MGAQAMKKKVLIGVAVFAGLIVIVTAAVLILFVKNPNLFFDMMAQEITEGEVREVDFEYEYDEETAEEGIEFDGVPAFKFTAPESGTYTVSITGVKSDADVLINLSIVDDKLEDIVTANNYDREMDGLTDTVTADVPMQGSHRSFILVETRPGNESVQKYSGSFNLTIAKAAEEEKPPVLSKGENVTLKVAADSQSCAVFTPEETGFYRFSTQLKNSGKSGGYSVVSSVASQDKRDAELTDGICLLEKGKEYYVWVAVYETSKKNSRVKLSCTGMDSASTAEKGEVRITGDTVIEYKPAESGNIAVYSVSDGDPKAIIYEKAGFPLRTDDDTEASLNENPDDFAVVLNAEAGRTYRICVFGEFTDCGIVITDYTGDGSSLTPDDIAPVPETSEDSSDENDPEEESADENSTETESADDANGE